MEKNVKTSEISNAYAMLRDAKLTRMEEAEQFAVIKTMRTLKGIVTEHEDFVKEAQEKLKPDNFDDLQRRARSFATLDEAEKARTNAEMADYDRKVTECVRPETEKVRKIELEPMGREAFGRLLKSNDFTASQMLLLCDILCEGDNQ